MVVAMIEREITQRLTTLFQQYPFVTVTGPRQSGKTTLCRATFPGLAYANLEAPDQRDFAASDPRGFLAQFGEGAIIDEVQHVPELLSYLQVIADERGGNGLFVLTGSEHFRLSEAVSQSLAGRTALLHLLPFSLAERRMAGCSEAVDDILYSGFYPRIIDQGLDPTQALADYFETYVERDVRRIGEIRNLSNFRRFVRLCAGRVSQLVNLSSLGSDAGVSHTTAREWLNILEMSYIIFQLPPYHANISKRLIKSPKFYFCDVGLAAYLIGIEGVGQVATHPLRGALFENAVVAEALKHRYNRGNQPNLRFFRDAKGLECDLLYPTGRGTAAIEVKSGSTIASDHYRSLHRVGDLVPDIAHKIVVYGGTDRQTRTDSEAIPLGDLGGVLEKLEVDREIAAFVDQNRGPTPAQEDVEALNTAYARHIRPTLDGLEPTLSPLAEGLFRNAGQQTYVTFHDVTSNSSSFLEPQNWERLMNQTIVKEGFGLSGSQPIEVKHCYLFGDYSGRGRKGFDLNLSILWTLDGERLSRAVEINGARIPEIGDSISYAELAQGNPGVDQLVAEVGGRIMRRVGELSNASGTGSFQ